jgi:hypothetical protein
VRIRRVDIENFRGIKSLEWRLNSNFVALLGPGDSTKTTILDALGLALSSRYNVTFTDADFYNCELDHPIRIDVTVTGLPDSLIEEQTQGHNRSGIDSEGNLYHDPEEVEEAEECLIVRLSVDSTLEPIWSVVRPGDLEGERISASQRAQLGFFRIGDQVDTHLRWGRSAALCN